MVVLREDLSSAERASFCSREAGRGGRKESVQGTMERGKPFLSSLHPPSAYYSFVYSVFNGIPSESWGLSCGAGRDFPQLVESGPRLLS